jgi:hypothetical protein
MRNGGAEIRLRIATLFYRPHKAVQPFESSNLVGISEFRRIERR